MTGIHAAAEQVVITSGAQNGILVAFAALTQPGDHILTESRRKTGGSNAGSAHGRTVSRRERPDP